MRVHVLVGVLCLAACGGKLVPTDNGAPGGQGGSTDVPSSVGSSGSSGSSSGSGTSSDSDSASTSDSVGSYGSSSGSYTSASGKTFDCSPTQMTTEDYGIIDVSKLGCECDGTSDCVSGSLCVQFGGLAHSRCTTVKQVCDLIDCGGATCIPFYGNQWAQPECLK